MLRKFLSFLFLFPIIILISKISQYTKNNAVDFKARKEAFCSNTDNSVCFFGRRFCHPGYTGELCNEKLKKANPWYTYDCPNLKEQKTFDENMPLGMISSGKKCPNEKNFTGASKCAYLCFSHEVTGVPQIPLSLWKIVQQNEFKFWKHRIGSNDRGEEHIEGFRNYARLPQKLGKYIEIGCGPYTQTQFIINHEFESITLLDPGADNYIKHTSGCTYKNGTLKGKNVNVLSFGGEKLQDKMFKEAFDTIMAINVVEHIWDAFKFFNNIYDSLKPGGIIIYHDRFYPDPVYGDRVLGYKDTLHAIRLTRVVFEQFFKNFETIYMFEGQTSDQVKRQCGEVGFYFIGRKK